MSLLTDLWDNWGYDEGRSMRFPSGLNGPYSDGEVYWKKSLDPTHTSKTINIIYSLTTIHYITIVTTVAAPLKSVVM
jgi:hypothetical protein